MLIGIIFILLFVLASGGQMCFNKFYQQNVENTLVSHYIYLLVMSFLAAICYYILAGFNLQIDTMSFIYALIACLVIVACQILTLICMANVNLTMVTVSTNAGNLLWPTLFGMIFLNEKISTTTIIGIIFILLAFFVPFIFNYNEIKNDKTTKIGYIICILLFLVSGHVNSINKLFTLSNSFTSNSSYLSWINIIMFPLVLLAFVFLIKR